MTPTMAQIADYIEGQFLVTLGVDFEPDTNLFEAGIMDSFGYVQLIGFLQSQFGLTLGDEDFLNNVMVSLTRMTETVTARLTPAAGG